MKALGKLFKCLFSRIKRFFKRLFCRKSRLESTTQEHWVNHIYDETVGIGGQWGTMQWGNLHGFEEGSGDNKIYWLGLDSRCWGIRISDMIIKCKNKATYDKYIEVAKWGGSELLHKAEADGNLQLTRGNNVEIKFVFKWGDDDKSFNVRLAGDFYAEEK